MSDQTETLNVGASAFDTQHESDEAFERVLAEALHVFEASGRPFLFIGGIASAVLGRPRWTHDVDVLVRPDDAQVALQALGDAGFETQETNPLWLYKAIKDEVVIDVIFKSKGDVYLDDEMIERAVKREFKGLTIPVISPEDFVVIKAAVHDEERPRHWHDALGILIRSDLDWDYLVHRARHASKRVLSLLIYAASNDIVIPRGAISTLYDAIYGDKAMP